MKFFCAPSCCGIVVAERNEDDFSFLRGQSVQKFHGHKIWRVCSQRLREDLSPPKKKKERKKNIQSEAPPSVDASKCTSRRATSSQGSPVMTPASQRHLMLPRWHNVFLSHLKFYIILFLRCMYDIMYGKIILHITLDATKQFFHGRSRQPTRHSTADFAGLVYLCTSLGL